mgnify:CR=1 FL=1
MDLKEQISAAIEKIAGDKSLLERFKADPVKAVESALGVDLPDEVVRQVISGVKAKLSADKLSDAAASLKKLF